MVQLLFSQCRIGLLHQRHENAIRGCCDGTRSRRGLLCGCLSLVDADFAKRLSPRRVGWTWLGFFVTTFLLCQPVVADPPPAGRVIQPAHQRHVAISEAQARSSVQWLADFALQKMPRTFDGDKDWGNTKEIVSGLKIRRDGLRISTKRRRKDVRHGRWIKYELKLPEAKPKHDPVDIKIHRVHPVGDIAVGTANADHKDVRWQIESTMETPMTFTARVERWNLGVQLWSISIEGKMKVRLQSVSTLGAFADYSEIPPALVVDPKVQSAELQLLEFEVDRVSKIGGDVAEEWGELMEKVVRSMFLKKQNESLANKLNKSIDKHRDDLRLSLSTMFEGW